jgi:nucleotide-binding universal stress UspA family protein
MAYHHGFIFHNLKKETIMKILFPVVRSTDVSKKFASYVKMVSKMNNAEIHLMRVHPFSEYMDGCLKENKKWLAEFSDEHFGDYPKMVFKVVPGHPSHEILKYIDDAEIDLVFMGTHGRRGLDSMFFRSVTSHISKLSPAPVLSMNPNKKKKVGDIKLGTECFDFSC